MVEEAKQIIKNELRAYGYNYASLADTATRREVLYEIKRLRDLYITRKLSEDNVFDSDIWEGFENEE